MKNKKETNYISVESMSNITKANLELLIREIQELHPNEAISNLLDSWIKGNDLHPEKIVVNNGVYVNTLFLLHKSNEKR
jgi:hypothetical protein